jgi:transcriptional regulator NrdR family protein
MNLQVQKKDGSMQLFDRTKILAGLVKSGATSEQAETVASQVEAWAQTGAPNGVIASLDLRAKVLEFLKVVNPVAGAAFESYQKTQVEVTVVEQPQETQEEPQV